MEPLSIDQALQYCLENPESLSDEELLGMFPQYREELEPLLAFDRQLSGAVPPRMPAESKALVRQRLVDRVVAKAPVEPTPVKTALRGTAAQTSPISTAKAPWWRRKSIAGAVAVAALLLVWWAASVSLPGNPLYPVKLGTENLLLNFAGTSPALIRGHLDLSNVRLVDIRTMQGRNSLAQAQPAVDNYNYHIRNCLTLWQARQDDKDISLAKLLYASSVAGQRVLAVFGASTGNTLPAALTSEVSSTLTSVGTLESSSAGVLRGAGVDLDQVLQQAGGTVASLLVPEQGEATPMPTTTTTALAGAQQDTPTESFPAVPTVTAVLYAAQTIIAGAGSSNEAGVAAAETVIAGEGGTSISTPVMHAIETVLAQPTFVVSVEPQVTAIATGTGLPQATILSTPQKILTALPTVAPASDLTPNAKGLPPTVKTQIPTLPSKPLASVTAILPPSGSKNIPTLTPQVPGAVDATAPTKEVSLPLPPKLPQP